MKQQLYFYRIALPLTFGSAAKVFTHPINFSVVYSQRKEVDYRQPAQRVMKILNINLSQQQPIS